MGRVLGISLGIACLLAAGLNAKADEVVQPLNGQWVVVELVEDGNVVPKEAIPEWLPSGGRMDIADGAIIFTSHIDGKKHATLYSIDSTRYPQIITLTKQDMTVVKGIFKQEGQKLYVCLSAPNVPTPPPAFASEPGSKQVLMVMQRAAATPPVTAANPNPAPPAHPAALVVTDSEVARMLIGTWQYDDSFGALIIQFRGDGTYSTTRSVEQLRMFKEVFIETPLSNGTWRVQKGQIVFNVLAALYADRVGQTFSFSVRSISATDFIFVDYLGRVGRATRIK
ncbi:TIGR03067 domain-containing protein [Planctomicrobium piriforme]|uniref:Uncharacterized domain TIGR03067 protein n=1 Tax=Planctomicrobium piriforme TaxID=1576369 RepID=A0A1I3MI60_9PLAN|nr:TIGR03067 domain-containing protein [Planctomicrobium piriforme]SFI96601.1 uncharacterized domain TIGR03067 protein [Planctomicrobium piriforme]